MARKLRTGEPPFTMTEEEQAAYDAAHAAATAAAEAGGTVVAPPEHYGFLPGGGTIPALPAPTTTPTTTPTGVRPERPPVTTPTFGEGVEIPPPVVTPAPEVSPAPTFEPVEVTPAPPYKISPEQQEMQELYGSKLTDWVTSGGYGLSPEVQAQMIQLQTDTLKAREQENIRVMRNNMERRGITNSGFLTAAEIAIHSNTSVAIAGAIADVQIKSALMKMASFEKGMGAMAQFLGYLSEQSQLAYAPEVATWAAQTQANFAAWQATTGGTLEEWKMKESNKFATWQAEQLASLQHWQGQLDILKIDLNAAYQTQNTILQAQLTSRLNTQQHQFDIELAEMEIEANQKIATAQGIGGIFGTILGFIFGK